jgi:hypothetical protein
LILKSEERVMVLCLLTMLWNHDLLTAQRKHDARHDGVAVGLAFLCSFRPRSSDKPYLKYVHITCTSTYVCTVWCIYGIWRHHIVFSLKNSSGGTAGLPAKCEKRITYGHLSAWSWGLSEVKWMPDCRFTTVIICGFIDSRYWLTRLIFFLAFLRDFCALLL